MFVLIHTDAQISLHTLLVKYNDLLGRQSSERGRDEVTYHYIEDFYVGHLNLLMYFVLQNITTKSSLDFQIILFGFQIT